MVPCSRSSFARLLHQLADLSSYRWEFQGKHKDGSLRVDIPLHSLHLLYNVNFSVVSQVNPHIHLFHFAPRGAPGRPVSHRRGKGWRGGFLLSAAEQFLKIELTKNFRVGSRCFVDFSSRLVDPRSAELTFSLSAKQVIRDLELLPELGGQNWSAVFLQKFEGTVTIWPKSRGKLLGPRLLSLSFAKLISSSRSVGLVPSAHRPRPRGAGENDACGTGSDLAKGEFPLDSRFRELLVDLPLTRTQIKMIENRLK